MAANAPGVLGALFDAADTLNALGALSTGIGFGLDSIYGPPPSDLKVAGTTVPVAHIGVTPPYVAAQACGFAGKVPTFAINGTGSPIPDGAVMTPGSGINRSGKACLVGAGVYAVDPTANLLQKTQAFDDAYWSKGASTVVANATTDPLGGATADKLVESATTATHQVSRGSLAGTAGLPYSVSIYAKAAERGVLVFNLTDSVWGAGSDASFDLVNGACVANLGLPTAQGVATMENVGNGWWRCKYAAVAGPGGTGSLAFSMQLTHPGSPTTTYAGDGTSGLYLWGPQFEQAPGCNPYVAVP